MELKPIRVIVIDDHPWVCTALRQYLSTCPDIAVVGMAAAADAGLELATTTHPDVAIVDLHLPLTGQANPTPGVFTHGIHLINTLNRQQPDVAVLALTGLLTPVTSQAALRAGARQCLPKNCHGPEIADAIRAVSRGGHPHGSNNEPDDRPDPCPDPMRSLTSRELEILHLLNQPLTSQQIAHQLRISQNTLATHRKNIYSKLGIACRIEAASWALCLDAPHNTTN